MLGLIFIYYIGKSYYRLASDHNKDNKWLYSVLGIIAYYAGVYGFAIMLGIYAEVSEKYEIYEMSDVMWSLVCFPFGIATCILLYMFLRHLFSAKKESVALDEWEVS